MPFINSTNPKIIQLVRKINERYPYVDLAEIVESALHGNKDSYSFLENEPSLQAHAKRFVANSRNKELAFKKYISALVQAQMHLNRQGDEYHHLKLSVIVNFPRARQEGVFQTFRSIADELYNSVGSQTETNFLNYLVDSLIDISLTRINGKKINIGDLDHELTSNKNGFILTGYQSEEVNNLFKEAANTQSPPKEISP